MICVAGILPAIQGTRRKASLREDALDTKGPVPTGSVRALLCISGANSLEFGEDFDIIAAGCDEAHQTTIDIQVVRYIASYK